MGCGIIAKPHPTSAGVMELVDVVDSKSTAGDSVPVRVRSPAPRRCGRHIVRSDFFIKKSLLTHSVAAPFRIEPASLGFDSVFFLKRKMSIILLRLFFQKSERAHAAAPPSQTEPAALGFAWVIPDGKRKFCIDKYVKIPHIPRNMGDFLQLWDGADREWHTNCR